MALGRVKVVFTPVGPVHAVDAAMDLFPIADVETYQVVCIGFNIFMWVICELACNV